MMEYKTFMWPFVMVDVTKLFNTVYLLIEFIHNRPIWNVKKSKKENNGKLVDSESVQTL